GAELLDIRPLIGYLVLALDAGENHLGALNLGARILDVFLERLFAPGNARVLVGVGIIVPGRAAGFAAVDPIELGTDLVLGVLADRVARQAFLERLLARRHVLRPCATRRGGESRRNQHPRPCHDRSSTNKLGRENRRANASRPSALGMTAPSKAVNRQCGG